MPLYIQDPNCKHKIVAALFRLPYESDSIGLISLRTSCRSYSGLLFSSVLSVPIECSNDEEARGIFKEGMKASTRNNWDCFYLGEPNFG